MICIRHLTPQLRKELKKPLGILFRGSVEEIIQIAKAMIEKERPPKTVTIGDRVSQDFFDHSITPNLMIIDNRIMRKSIPPISATAETIIHAHNPPGTITDEAWAAIETASKSPTRTKIIVDGEEDLLALVAILAVPENSLIFYGQPRKGVVAVKATSTMKKRVENIVNQMKAR